MSINMECIPESLDRAESDIEDILSKVSNTTFGEDDWNVVVEECSPLASKWQQLSPLLGLKHSLIDRIKNDFPRDSVGCWNEALKEWIKLNYITDRYSKPSWRTLLKAIAKIDQEYFRRLAAMHQLEDKAFNEENHTDKMQTSSNQASHMSGMNEFSTPQNKLKLATHKKEYTECCVIGKTSEGENDLFVSLDHSFDNCTLSHLDFFISKLRKMLNIPSNVVLRLYHVSFGSIKLIFQLPDCVQQGVFPLSGDQEAQLIASGVIQLSYGDYKFAIQDNRKTSEGTKDTVEMLTSDSTYKGSPSLQLNNKLLDIQAESNLDTKQNLSPKVPYEYIRYL